MIAQFSWPNMHISRCFILSHNIFMTLAISTIKSKLIHTNSLLLTTRFVNLYLPKRRHRNTVLNLLISCISIQSTNADMSIWLIKTIRYVFKTLISCIIKILRYVFFYYLFVACFKCLTSYQFGYFITLSV